MDIVNKLKEFDTKYNMFFNDEDKRNYSQLQQQH